MELKVKRAWRTVFLRHVRNGVPDSVAAKMAKIGLDVLNRERRNDLEFVREMDDLKAQRG